MAANAAGIYGAQLFRSDDKPRYHRGLTINVVLIAAALAFAIFQGFYYRRKKLAEAKATQSIASSQDSDIASEHKDSPDLEPVDARR